MDIKEILEHEVKRVLQMQNPDLEMFFPKLVLDETRKEFEGDYTLVVFPLIATLKSKPEQVAQRIGQWLMEHSTFFSGFNVVQGFLNLTVRDERLTGFIKEAVQKPFWESTTTGRKVMVEYSSPNTNKPLHLGHIRNMLLGASISKILKKTGNQVVNTQVINDRGIAICKSMVAWKAFSGGATPESTHIKSDHFVGDYYVMFESKFQEEYRAWQQTEEADKIYEENKGKTADRETFFKLYKNQYFNQQSELGRLARTALVNWENGDADTVALWKKMNSWVYEGFEKTYEKMGVTFDINYYESETYLLGKEIVDKGLESGLFYRKEDGSVWVDLESAGLDHKVLLRSDGTSVYITQDIGTAEKRYEAFAPDQMIYVVADEQNYHFQVLFEILKRMKVPYASGLYHLSYGMVELPEGKMKSREGTVVDADDLLEEVIREATKISDERGELGNLPVSEKQAIIETIGKGALKYFMLKVQPKKKMLFDPRESVDMQGNTGPYIQNAYVRIQSILRKYEEKIGTGTPDTPALVPEEKELIKTIAQYKRAIHKAAQDLDPSEIAGFCYQLARTFHRFYHECPILSAEDPAVRTFRAQLASLTALVLRDGMELLGIDMPDRM